METIKRLFSTEPALIIGAFAAVLVALGAFNVPITDKQVQALTALVGAIIVLGSALVTRSQVYAPATVDAIVEDLLYEPAAGDEPVE